MIVILNGPAGCGKDTLAGLLHDCCNIEVLSFKAPMFEMAEASLGSYYTEFLSRYNNRETKESPLQALGGFSPRAFFIHISEVWCKPVFGDDYFGKRLLASAKSAGCTSVVSDGGFPSEVVPLITAGEKVVIVRLHRKGFTFDGDSRNYVNEDNFKEYPKALLPTFIDFEVEGRPEQSAGKLIKILGLDKL